MQSLPRRRPGACPAACHLPLSPHTPHPLPYPHAHPHAPDRNRHLPRSQENLDASRLRQPLQPNAARCWCRACPGEGRGRALPCFPLSVCGDPTAMPSAPLRRRGPQIRLVPLFQPFQHPPAGPLAPRPARAWQIRLVSLCRLVHLGSNPICAAFPQARAAGKSRTHHSAQFKPNPPPQLAAGAEPALPLPSRSDPYLPKVWVQGLPCRSDPRYTEEHPSGVSSNGR